MKNSRLDHAVGCVLVFICSLGGSLIAPVTMASEQVDSGHEIVKEVLPRENDFTEGAGAPPRPSTVPEKASSADRPAVAVRGKTKVHPRLSQTGSDSWIMVHYGCLMIVAGIGVLGLSRCVGRKWVNLR